MKKYIYMAVAAIAALSSCSSDNEFEQTQIGNQGLVFTATMEGSEGTRATYDATNKCAAWELGDKININGKIYSAQEAGTTTTFKADGEDATGTTYNAYFPASLYNGTTATLPDNINETWAAGKFNMPMYATSTTTDLAFKNLCGVLKITVNSGQIATVKKIKVSSADKAVSGAFSVVDNAAVLNDPDVIANTLTVTYTDAVTTTEEGLVFYVAVPAQTYKELKIELADGSGFTKSMTTKSATDITVARNKIYSITFADNAATTGTAKRTGDIDVNWVQLWENGPKFAEYNVGAANNKAEDYGGYYAWGGTYNNDPNLSGFIWTDDHNTGFSELSHTGDDITDTATILWGSEWRMPTQTDLQGLLDNCDVAWIDGEKTKYNGTTVAGLLCTGRTERYSSNSVFLPAAGYCNYGYVCGQGNYGYYWSSTPNGSDYACRLDFNAGYQNVDSCYRDCGYSVRAVLAE